MKAEIVNSFIGAALKVFNSFSPDAYNVGTPFLREDDFEADDIVIILGITGEIKGQAALSMNFELAKSIASQMMMGMPVTEIDDMAKSALSELGNMIMGNAATLLYNNGIQTDITPPSLVVGQSMQISTPAMEQVCVPLNGALGTVHFEVGVKKE